jgi:uncharacterized protein
MMGSVIVDLDSHLMEPREWLVPFAPRRLADDVLIPAAPPREALRRAVHERAPGAAADPACFGGQDLWLTPGAFDRIERAAVCRAAGISRQLVLSDGAHVAFAERPDLLPDAVRAQHRAALAWADGDQRFVPAALVPLDDPTLAWILAGEAAAIGFPAVHLTTTGALPPPPHTATMDRVWETLAGAGVAAVLHFGTTGGGPGQVWHDGPDLPGVADPLDVLLAHHGAETYLGRLALSGVLHRHPRLRLVVAEHGAGWLPGFLATLDAVQSAFAGLPLPVPAGPPDGPPLSEAVRAAVVVVPSILDDVRALTGVLGPGLLAFGSDFPHPEGGPDPVARTTAGLTPAEAAAFLHGTAGRVLPTP